MKENGLLSTLHLIEFKDENCVKSAIYGTLYEYKWVELGSISAVVSQVNSGDIKTNYYFATISEVIEFHQNIWKENAL